VVLPIKAEKSGKLLAFFGVALSVGSHPVEERPKGGVVSLGAIKLNVPDDINVPRDEILRAKERVKPAKIHPS